MPILPHDKCYAICEAKCKVETLSKGEIYEIGQPKGATSSYNDKTKEMTLTVSRNPREKVIGNTKIPQKILIELDSDVPVYIFAHSWFRFNKGMGTSLSGFFEAPEGYTLKYLNQPDITNWTRIFLEVFVEDKIIYLRIDGC